MPKNSFRDYKKRVALDQQNIIVGTVIGNGSRTINVRLADGRERRVSNPNEIPFLLGDVLEIKTDGNYFQISDKSQTVAPGGEVIFTV